MVHSPDSPRQNPETLAERDVNKTMVISNLEITVQHPTEASEPEFKQIGPYRIVKVIGFGGVGTVYEAVDHLLNRPVALKVLNKKWLTDDIVKQRFMREARLCSMIKSPHVPLVHLVGEDQGIPYLAMELLAGFTLDDLMKTSHQFTIQHVMRLGREMAKGLAAAHAMKLIHRDIKPSNIWLETMPDPTGAGRKMFRVKILDFGMARLQEQTQGLTRHGVIVGTPQYMSPEQATGRGVDARSDLFSLGIVLYRLCTGKIPFTGRSATDIINNIVSEDPVPARDLNPAVPIKLSRLISRMMKKSANDRPPDAMNVARLLEIIEEEEQSNPLRAKPLVPVVPTPEAEQTAPTVIMPAQTNPLRVWLIASIAINVILLMTIVFLLGTLWKR